jgi:hypothetical protein
MGNESVAPGSTAGYSELIDHPHLGLVQRTEWEGKPCLLKYLNFGDGFLMEETLRRMRIRMVKLADNSFILNVQNIVKL